MPYVIPGYREERAPARAGGGVGARVASIANRQGGAIACAQLHALGVDDRRIHRLVGHGWLVRVHRGVYRLGALTADGQLWAAVLALGPHAVLTHLSAACVHGLVRGPPSARVDVGAPTRKRARRGIRPRETWLDRRDVTTRRGLPVTTVARTLLDIAAELSQPAIQAAVDEARVLRKLHPPSIEAVIARTPGHRGSAALRRAVARHDPGRGRPVGEFERRAIAFLRDYGFPRYERNYVVEAGGEPFTVDVLWGPQRVALEFDSRAYHDNDPAFATDRRRSRRLAAIGIQLVRATWEDLDERPAELAADLWALLRATARS